MIAGLTGNIGSGKSTVARVFEMLGCAVFYSDAVAKQVYFDPAIQKQVIGLLGTEAYLDANTLHKNFISQKIFSNTDLLQKLNAIIHPAVVEEFKRFAKQHAGKVILKETALLFEARLNKEVDKIVVVESPDALRIKRVMQRDGLTEEQVKGKMRSQLSQEEKIKHADFVIHNDEEALLIPQILEIYHQLKS